MTGDYRLTSEPTAERATFHCTGTLAGVAHEWQVELYTLAAYCARYRPAAGTCRQVIELSIERPGRGHIIVALAVARLTEATLGNTVKMLRLWKNLAPGRHEWGEAVAIRQDGHLRP